MKHFGGGYRSWRKEAVVAKKRLAPDSTNSLLKERRVS